MMWTREEMAVLDEMAETVVYGEGCEGACETCPYADRCEAGEGWWSCPCWEEGMGDDV